MSEQWAMEGKEMNSDNDVGEWWKEIIGGN